MPESSRPGSGQESPGPAAPHPDSARTRPAPLPVAEVEKALRRNHARYLYVYVDFLAEQLADISRVFSGDLQMVVLLAAIGQVSLSAAIAAEAGGRTAADLAPERRGVTTNRLADKTGIPRETVRRKLIAMQKMGWLTREDNFWFLTTSGEDTVVVKALADLDDRAIVRTARLYSNLAHLIAAPQA